MRIFSALQAALGAVLLFLAPVAPVALIAGYASPALAACSVGGNGQPPCKIWERIPSCDKGLVEDFRVNRCVRPEQHSYYRVCGGSNQRPCTVLEAFPSCHPGLVENFRNPDRCVTPDRNCGSLGAEPCPITERFPSCNPGLAEDFLQHRCVMPAGEQQICEGIVNAFASGVMPPGFRATTDYLNQRKRDLQGHREALPPALATAGKDIAPVIAESQRIVALMAKLKNTPEGADLFSARTLCGDPRALRAKLVKLNILADAAAQPAPSNAQAADVTQPFPNGGRLQQFGFQPRAGGSRYLAVSFAGTGAAVVSGTVGFTIVTDLENKDDEPMVFVYAGVGWVTNVLASGGASVIYYPSMRPADFPGWFREVEVSLGGVVSGGARASMVGAQGNTGLAGIGGGGSIGASVSPVEIGDTWTFSWPMRARVYTSPAPMGR